MVQILHILCLCVWYIPQPSFGIVSSFLDILITFKEYKCKHCDVFRIISVSFVVSLKSCLSLFSPHPCDFTWKWLSELFHTEKQGYCKVIWLIKQLLTLVIGGDLGLSTPRKRCPPWPVSGFCDLLFPWGWKICVILIKTINLSYLSDCLLVFLSTHLSVCVLACISYGTAKFDWIRFPNCPKNFKWNLNNMQPTNNQTVLH